MNENICAICKKPFQTGELIMKIEYLDDDKVGLQACHFGCKEKFIFVPCGVCETDTLHKYVKSEIFEKGLLCMVCHTEWEAE